MVVDLEARVRLVPTIFGKQTGCQVALGKLGGPVHECLLIHPTGITKIDLLTYKVNQYTYSGDT